MATLQSTLLPPKLGVTKEMMFRGPQVEDMEHQEPNEQTEPLLLQHITTARQQQRPPHQLGPHRKTDLAS